jgi:hypothetical protein
MDPRVNESDSARERRAIQDGLAPLFARARKEGLCFYAPNQGIWFKPDELAKEQSEGRFNWGACNWQLRDPNERVRDAKRAVESAKRHLEEMQKWIRAIGP